MIYRHRRLMEEEERQGERVHVTLSSSRVEAVALRRIDLTMLSIQGRYKQTTSTD